MRQASDSLFSLVKSLSKSEKRYFKIFSGKDSTGTKSYLELFDILNGMEVLDKDELKKRIKEKNLTTDLLKTRQYLFDAIIKALIFYYAENDSEFRMRMQLLQLLVLNKKELHSLAQKKLKIFERNCAKHHRTMLLAETYAMMKTNAFNLFLNNYDHHHLQELMLKEEANLKTLINESKFRSLLIQTLTLIKNESRMSREEAAAGFRKLENDPLLQEAGRAKTLRSRLMYLSLLSVIQFRLHKTAEALKSASAYLSLLEKNKHLMKRNTFYYIVGLRNKIIALLESGRHRETKAMLQKLKDVSCQNTNQEIIRFRTYYTFSLMQLTREGDFENASRLIPEIEENLARFGTRVDLHSSLKLRLLMAEVLFEKKDFDNAVTKLQNILNEPKIKDFPGLYILTKILLLMSHYELGSMRLVSSLARSILRLLKKEGMETSFEFAFVKAFLDKEIRPETFSGLLMELDSLVPSESLQPLLDYTKMKRYLKSKANEEVLAETAER